MSDIMGWVERKTGHILTEKLKMADHFIVKNAKRMFPLFKLIMRKLEL